VEGDVNQIRKLAPAIFCFNLGIAGREEEIQKKWADPLLMKTPGRAERGSAVCFLFWGFLTNLKVKYIPNRESV
jgi:hypothetical protein